MQTKKEPKVKLLVPPNAPRMDKRAGRIFFLADQQGWILLSKLSPYGRQDCANYAVQHWRMKRYTISCNPDATWDQQCTADQQIKAWCEDGGYVEGHRNP